MISIQTIHDRMLAALDAEGSDRYTFNEDTKYAITGAISTTIALFNSAFGENKLSPEQLRELVYIKVWQASQYSRIAFNATKVGHNFWTIFGVYPKIVANQKKSGTNLSNKSESMFRPDLSYLSSYRSAKRLSFEKWNENALNAFEAGNTILNGSLADYAYLDFANYTSTSYDTGGADKVELEIRPAVPGELVAIAYLKHPTPISALTDSVEFPESLTNLIVEIALNEIAIKQGDGTSLFLVSDRNVNRLVALMK